MFWKEMSEKFRVQIILPFNDLLQSFWLYLVSRMLIEIGFRTILSQFGLENWSNWYVIFDGMTLGHMVYNNLHESISL